MLQIISNFTYYLLFVFSVLDSLYIHVCKLHILKYLRITISLVRHYGNCFFYNRFQWFSYFVFCYLFLTFIAVQHSNEYLYYKLLRIGL